MDVVSRARARHRVLLAGDGPLCCVRRGRSCYGVEILERGPQVQALARAGMDVARINCAHDDRAAWEAMARHVREAGAALGRDITILMDIAGPKIRTERVITREKKGRITLGQRLLLVTGDPDDLPKGVDFAAG